MREEPRARTEQARPSLRREPALTSSGALWPAPGILAEASFVDIPFAAPAERSERRSEQADVPPKERPNTTGIPTPLLRTIEGVLRHDLSQVRVHPDSPKAPAVGALAYAQGTDVHVAPGQFRPDTPTGQRLLAHELAHVVQQAQGRVRPTRDVGGVAINDDPALEGEADRMAARAQAAAGRGMGVVVSTQRMADPRVIPADTSRRLGAAVDRELTVLRTPRPFPPSPSRAECPLLAPPEPSGATSSDHFPTLQRVAALAHEDCTVVQLKRLDERLSAGDTRVAVAGETHEEVNRDVEMEAFKQIGIELRHESDDIARSPEQEDTARVTPDNVELRMMFLAAHVVEFVGRLEIKVLANDGSHTITEADRRDAKAIFPLLSSESKRLSRMLKTSESQNARPEAHLTTEVLLEFKAAINAFHDTWKASVNSTTPLTPHLISGPARAIVGVFGRMEEMMASVQGVAIAPSSDYSLVRSGHMYRVISELANERDKLIYKVGDSHIGEMRQIIGPVNPRVELLNRAEYLKELYDLLDVLSPATKDNRSGGDVH